jgi:AcrR family transcriptional regulator
MAGEKSLDTRDGLLQAARALIDSQGVGAVTMRKVATDCGVSATAIYRHFDDKDALLAALLVESFGRFHRYLIDSERPRTALMRFRRIAQCYFDFSQECPHDYRLIFMTNGESLGFHRLDEAQMGQVNGTFGLLVRRISECQDAGIFRDDEPRLVGAHVWAAFHGLASLLLTGGLGVSETEAHHIANYQLSQLERSLLVSAQETPRFSLRIKPRPVPCEPGRPSTAKPATPLKSANASRSKVRKKSVQRTQPRKTKGQS